jgi:hypothetical protein
MSEDISTDRHGEVLSLQGSNKPAPRRRCNGDRKADATNGHYHNRADTVHVRRRRVAVLMGVMDNRVLL